MTAPVESVTFPKISPVLICAAVAGAVTAMSRHASRARPRINSLIHPPESNRLAKRIGPKRKAVLNDGSSDLSRFSYGEVFNERQLAARQRSDRTSDGAVENGDVAVHQRAVIGLRAVQIFLDGFQHAYRRVGRRKIGAARDIARAG